MCEAPSRPLRQNAPALFLLAVGGGVRIALRAQPKASRNAVVGALGERLKVAVTAAPAAGKANKAIEKTLAKALGVRPSAVAIVAGHRARDKTAQVIGLSLHEVQQRLGALLEQ